MTEQNATGFRRYIRYGYLVLVTVAFMYALYAQWGNLSDGLAKVGVGKIVFSTSLATLGVGISGLAWLAIIRGLGATISLHDGARMFFLTQLGKYVPGSLWPVAMQADIATQLDIPVRVAVMAQVLFMWVLVVTSAVLGSFAGLGFLYSAFQTNGSLWFALLSPLLLIFLHPKVTVTVLNGILKGLGRDPLPGKLGWGATLQAVGWSLVMWAIYAAHLWVIHDPLLSKGWLDWPVVDYLIMLSLFAAAWLVGFVIVIAPAGAGPRELVIVATLGVYPGVIVAVVSRVALIIADGLCAGLAALLQVRRSTQ